MGEARTYPVVVRGLEAGETGPGFFVHCPVMPGVLSEGATREEALANIREAISLALENRAKEGWEVAELVMVTVEENG
jgi:predicted RNase H-like HicB family nuclease